MIYATIKNVNNLLGIEKLLYSHKMKKTQKKKGFTLVELLVVIAIMGILIITVTPIFQKYLLNSKMSEGYLHLKHMYEGAVIEASHPSLMVQAGGNQTFCKKKWLFGNFASHIVDGGSALYIPPRGGVKEKIALSPTTNGTEVGPDGGCLYSNDFTSFGQYGFSPAPSGNHQTENPGYFAVSNIPDSVLATELQNDGKSLMGTTAAGVITHNSLWAYADLDGDFDYQADSSAQDQLGLQISTVSNRSNKVTYLMRGIYISNRGEVRGTDAVYTENLGE